MSDTPVINASFPAVVARAGKIEKSQREQEIDDVKAVMSSVSGRAFIWRLLERGGVFRCSYVGGDSHATTFNEGIRSSALATMSDVMEACPDLYQIMTTEAQQRKRLVELQLEAEAKKHRNEDL